MRHVLSALLLSIIILLPSMANAETYEGLYERTCPNAPELKRLGHQYDRAHALLDDSRYAIAKKLAAGLYDCSTAVSDPYERDVAKYFSLVFTGVASFTRDAPNIASQFNELAASTPFRSIRKMAIQSRDDYRK